MTNDFPGIDSRWFRSMDAVLSRASKQIQVVTLSTPTNLVSELDRLHKAWLAGHALPPEFQYRSCFLDTDAIALSLETLVESVPDQSDLSKLYQERARELAYEARMCRAVGKPQFVKMAQKRFYQERDVCSVCDLWLQTGLTADQAEKIQTDDAINAKSLLSQIKREIGDKKLPIRIVVMDNMSALAATGDGFIQVAAGRFASEEDGKRVMVHEVYGHALPWIHAQAYPFKIFDFGTANGSIEQEGYALWQEQKAGCLTAKRKRTLALRHLAAVAVHDGADFVETTRMLLQYEEPLLDALRIAMRVHRGGGLAREIVYIPALLNLEDMVVREPRIVEWMGQGRLSIYAARVLGKIV